ncbi:DUF7344 domain-containing protein [Halorussus caseinilyticus]|uniref:DUF7344 domain-containing protein n=1 Tax=Halorussus caseinilyticus TaxID=3034025 RepID=A0ABD5WI18_9EURY|nr:hypothetical protein [Halorussus sp. DT72]
MSKPDDLAAESLTPDQALDLLGDGQRRRAVAVLRESDGPMTLGELAAETVARGDETDSGPDPSEVTTDRRERVATRLHHVHLPRLDDAGVAEYDPMAGEVELTEVVEELDPYFEVVEGR